MGEGFSTLLLWTAGLGLATGLGAIAGALHVSSWRYRVALGLLALICMTPGALLLLALRPELVDARYGTYKAFYADIEVGMTREDVLGLVAVHYPLEGSRQPPKIIRDDEDDLNFFMNCEGRSGPNCEGIFIDLERGHVTRKHYSRD